MKIVAFFNRKVSTAVLGGFLFGYNATVIAGALGFLSKTFNLGSFQEGLAVSILFFGAVFATTMAGTLANHWGRVGAMKTSAFFFLVGGLIASLAGDYSYFLLGRFVTGFAVGLSVTVVPMYLVEIASDAIRGAVAHTNQIAIAIGMLMAYFSNYLFVASENWRLMLLLGVIPAVIQFICLSFLPESPYMSRRGAVKGASWKELFSSSCRSRLIVGGGLAAFQQLIGLNAVYYFSPMIFKDAGYTEPAQAILATLAVGVVNMIAIFISFWFIDKAGRFPLLLWSVSGMIVSLLVLSLAFFINLSFVGVIAILGLMSYLAFYTLGLGPVPPLVMAEIFPIKIRGHALMFMGIIGWLCNAVVALTFIDLTEWITPAGAFCFYALIGVFGLWFVAKKVSETKGQALEQ
jgi:SP family galactose:H+ symporter-like MFS transporter